MIVDSASDQNLEERVVNILNEISVGVSSIDIETCHPVGVSKNTLKKTTVRVINRQHAKKALISKRKLRKHFH